MIVRTLLTRHPPAVVRAMTIPEGKAACEGIWEERRQQTEALAQLVGAMMGG